MTTSSDHTKYVGGSVIMTERSRQIHEEGYTLEGDRGRVDPLLRASRAYARAAEAAARGESWSVVPQEWPWGERFWKPTWDDPECMMAKAGALMAAAIDAHQLSKPKPVPVIAEAEDGPGFVVVGHMLPGERFTVSLDSQGTPGTESHRLVLKSVAL